MAVGDIQLRDASLSDIGDIARMYNYYVANSFASWEYDECTLTEMTDRLQLRLDKEFPAIVAYRVNADGGNTLVGFAWVGPFRSRIGYRYCVENTVYVHPEHLRKGIGALLLDELIARCKAAGFRAIIAGISLDSRTGEGTASIELHKSRGFVQTARFPHIGLKFDKWLDAVFMQLDLVADPEAPPDELALPAPLRLPHLPST